MTDIPWPLGQSKILNALFNDPLFNNVGNSMVIKQSAILASLEGNELIT